jgi:hypothetical protein
VEQLNDIQREMIAGLTENPAFVLLLQMMAGSIRAIEDDLEHCLDERKSKEILSKWRAMKWAYNELKTQPERFTEELKEYHDQMKAAMGGVYFPDIRVNQASFPFAQFAEADD